MKFLYQYYFVMFEYHLRDTKSGRINSAAWKSTILQIAVSFTLLFLCSTALILKAADAMYIFERIGKIGVLLFYVLLPYWLIYYLLFKYYNVSKETGKTDKYEFQTTRGLKRTYWTFFCLSGPITVVLTILYVKGLL